MPVAYLPDRQDFQVSIGFTLNLFLTYKYLNNKNILMLLSKIYATLHKGKAFIAHSANVTPYQ